jgi:hypothetical protein
MIPPVNIAEYKFLDYVGFNVGSDNSRETLPVLEQSHPIKKMFAALLFENERKFYCSFVRQIAKEAHTGPFMLLASYY